MESPADPSAFSQLHNTPEFVHLAMTRVKPWQPWPTGTVSVQQGFTSGTLTGVVELLVTTYSQQDQAALDASPMMWASEPSSKNADVIGSTIVLSPGSSSTAVVDSVIKARPGDIDIICGTMSNEEADWLPQYLTSLVYAVSATLSIACNDIFQVVAPVATRRVARGEREGFDSPPFDIDVRHKKTVAEEVIRDALQQAIQPFVSGRIWGERILVLSSAVRRFMIAGSRTNPVDRFLDYWLACEFLTSHMPKDGGIHSKIAKSLSEHMGRSTSSGKKKAENALRLKDLSSRRGEIVHGMREDIPPDDLKLLTQIANELVRKELGIAYAHNPVLEEALAERAKVGKPDRPPHRR
jgi:hypothetical protein